MAVSIILTFKDRSLLKECQKTAIICQILGSVDDLL